MLFFDTETCLTGPGNKAPPLVCLSAFDGGLYDRVTARDWAIRALRSGLVIGAWNAAFDWAVIMQQWPDLAPEIFQAYDADRIVCLMIREQLGDIAKGDFEGFYYHVDASGPPRSGKIGYSLAASAKRRLGVDLEKTQWRLGYGDLINVPLSQWPEGAREYARMDAQILPHIYASQEETHGQYMADQFRQSRASFWLHLSASWGLTTDPVAVAAFERETRERVASLRATLAEAGLVRPDRIKRDGTLELGARNVKAVQARIQAIASRDGIALRPEDYTASGAVATGEDTCLHMGDPILADYAALSSVTYVLSKDVPLLQAGAGGTPIHTRYDLAVSGRATSSKPNIMNTPRDGKLKACFVPRPHCVFIHIDASGLELATMAQVWVTLGCGEGMARDLRAGVDRHSVIAAEILGCSYTEAVERVKAGDKKAKNARQTGKVANFGLPGGLGIERLCVFARSSYGVVLSPEEARDLKALWLRLNPEAQAYFRLMDQAVRVHGCVEQIFSGRLRGGVGYTDACNTMFQGLGADVMKHWGWLVTRECYADPRSPLYSSRIVVFEHDALIVESPENRAPEAAIRLEQLMAESGRAWLPDVPLKGEAAIAKRWEKDPKRMFDRDGRLTWEK